MIKDVGLVRLGLGILLHEVATRSCVVELAVNDSVLMANVTGKLGGLVCNDGSSAPAWVFGEGGSLSTISHLSVPRTGGYVFHHARRDPSGLRKAQVVDELLPGWTNQAVDQFAQKRDEQLERICIGTLKAGTSRFKVSFGGRLGPLLCSGLNQRVPRVRTLSNECGFMTFLLNLQLSRHSTVGFHRQSSDETLVVGLNRSMVWPGLLDGSNWGESASLRVADEDPNAWSYFCSSRCATCTTPLLANCKGELVPSFATQGILQRPSMNVSTFRKWVSVRSENLTPDDRTAPYVMMGVNRNHPMAKIFNSDWEWCGTKVTCDQDHDCMGHRDCRAQAFEGKLSNIHCGAHVWPHSCWVRVSNCTGTACQLR
ncbi:hypothetical protein CDD80_6150 [Ophiocordyceps camponoti-rufipedis]|uniref:Uncharacterized protein n=1 Tax=Ophiocordyceps camponoti-rufipedis TaxID=2004952 RepID=A0A2C5XF86_9HYPO|nr:hypothetical protein CDD80_6150 [Ophiocordyceps camponoti-rufipedis]